MGSRTILIVDDSRIMRNIVKNTLITMRRDYDILEASNGNEALEKLTTNDIDLVLLDWNMPQLSGIEFLKKVRGTEQYKNLPIIMITSEAARYNVVEALKCGVTAYIIKPLNERNFYEHLTKIQF